MDFITSTDGLKLHLRRWPAAGAARGTVQIVHGLGEHLGRYAWLAAQLNAAGWNVAGHDLRGHGASDGRRGFVADSRALPADLALVFDAVRSGGRHLLLGHSLGGLIAARFVAEALAGLPAPWSRPVDGLVLSSPALAVDFSAVQRALLALLAPVAPRLSLPNGLDPAWLSRDPSVVAAYRADPLVHDRITPRLARFIVDAGTAVRQRAPCWSTPTLLLWATADRCVAPRGSADFAAAAPPGVVTAVPLPGLAHEIFNEPERDAVFSHLQHWLAHCGA